MPKKELLKAINEVLFDLTVKLNEEFGNHFLDISERYRLVIILLAKYQSLYVKDVAKSLHISSSSASQLLSKMEAEQYIHRELDPDQRRQTFVKLDKEGEQALSQMEQTRDEIFSNYFNKLSYDDLAAFHHVAAKMTSIMESES